MAYFCSAHTRLIAKDNTGNQIFELQINFADDAHHAVRFSNLDSDQVIAIKLHELSERIKHFLRGSPNV